MHKKRQSSDSHHSNGLVAYFGGPFLEDPIVVRANAKRIDQFVLLAGANEFAGTFSDIKKCVPESPFRDFLPNDDTSARFNIVLFPAALEAMVRRVHEFEHAESIS